MKKLLLYSAFLAIGASAYAQAVPNGSFESWSSVPYNDPTGWNNGNRRDIGTFGAASVTKVAGYSGFAMRIETMAVAGDTSESYAINTENPCGDPSSWTGGVPYSQLPTAITGYYRYSLPGSDTALMIVIFRKNGSHVGDNFIKIRGTGSQLTFAPFSFPLSCSVVPDTVIIAAASSNKISNMGIQDGSFIEFDNLAFTGTTQIIPNGDFETWTAQSYDAATGWNLWGSGAGKTTTSYFGGYAMRLETADMDCGYVNPSGATTGQLSGFSGPYGGLPYTGMTDTLCGYYKYAPMGTDSAAIFVNLTNNGSPVGGAWKTFGAAAAYTYFEMPISAFSVPDTMRIDIQSSEWPVAPTSLGSVLYIDHLALKSMPLGIAEPKKMKSFFYPNPVNSILTVQFERIIPGRTDVYIYDATGRMLNGSSYVRNANSLTIDVSGLSSGIYFYEIRTAEGMMRDKFIKE